MLMCCRFWLIGCAALTFYRDHPTATAAEFEVWRQNISHASHHHPPTPGAAAATTTVAAQTTVVGGGNSTDSEYEGSSEEDSGSGANRFRGMLPVDMRPHPPTRRD